MRTVAIAAAIGLVTVSLAPAPAEAAGCLKGAILGGIAGYYAGHHSLLGAGAGCFLGREWEHRSDGQQTTTQQQYRTATTTRNAAVVGRDRDGNPIYKDKYGRLIARNQTATPYQTTDQNGNPVTKYRVQMTGYGSSTPQ